MADSTADDHHHEAQRSPSRTPFWLPCGLVAVVGWLVGVHQVGPLSVWAEPRQVSVLWYLLEQVVSVTSTLAGLAAGVILFGGRAMPLRRALDLVCRARWPLALAAALASRATLQAFVPPGIFEASDAGLRLTLGPGQWIWIVLATLATAGLMLRAALHYLQAVHLSLPPGGRALAALVVGIVTAELAARLLVGKLWLLLLWPP